MQVVSTHRGYPHSSKCRSLQRETGQVCACRKVEQQILDSESSPRQVNPLPSASTFFHQVDSNRETYIFHIVPKIRDQRTSQEKKANSWAPV